MNTLLEAVAVLSGIGFLLGVILAIASRKLSEEVKSQLFKKVRAALANLNCGACGYPNCDAYADAIVSKKAALNLCVPGGKKTEETLREVMEGVLNE